MEIINSYADPREFRFMELVLSQPKWSKRYFELKFDEEIIATLDWPTWYKPTCHASTAFGDWTIKRVGIFNPKVTVRRHGQKRDLFSMNLNHFMKGNLKLGDRQLKWRSIDMWRSEMGWIENERDVMTFKLSYSLSKNRFAKMRVIKMDYSDEEMSVLMLVGLYMIHMLSQSG